MDSVSKEVKKIVIILGAKPEADLPDISPIAVIAANGSAEIALKYREKFGTKIISMVPGKDLYEQAHIRESIKKCAPDELLLLGTTHIEDDPLGYVEKELDLSQDKVKIISLHHRNWNLAKAFGWRRYIIFIKGSLMRGIKHPFFVVIPDLFGSKNCNWMGRSTGLNAILYGMDRFKDAESIIVAGIGLQMGGHFNNVGVYKKKTAMMDQLTMKYWVLDKRARVYTTDSAMSKIGHVPMWRGEIFKA